MVMYMAGMANIPASLYEAADLDGAGKIGKFFNVTLPLIWNSIRTTLTFFIISTINLSFLLVQILTDGGPDGSTESVLKLHVQTSLYKLFIRIRYGNRCSYLYILIRIIRYRKSYYETRYS